MDHFNEIMPETDDKAVCIKVTKPITRDGMIRNLKPRVQDMVERHGEIRLLVYYADYHGWEENAVSEDMNYLLQFGGKVRKIALVAPPEKEIFKAKVNQPLIAGETRVFGDEELKDAINWVRT